MLNISFSTFAASSNPMLAAPYALMIDAMCLGADGGNLNRPDLLDWFEKGVICYVAQDLDVPQVVGGAAITPEGDTAILTAVGVVPEARGSRLATQLMKRVIDDCAGRGFKRIKLVIRLYEEGLPEGPYRLYLSHGFQLEPGVEVTPIGWNMTSRHLWLHQPDPGGVFKSRVMTLNLMTKASLPAVASTEADDAA